MSKKKIPVKSDLSDFAKIDTGKKIIIAVILITCFVIGLAIPSVVSNALYKSTQPVTPTPTPTAIPLPASLRISALSQSIKIGEEVKVAVSIDSPNQGVEAAEWTVKFDPDYLRIATVSGGNFFRVYSPFTLTDNSAGFSGVAEYVADRFVIPVGKGILSNITFEALEATDSTRVYVSRDDTVIASKGKNILDTTEDLLLNIKNTWTN